MTPKLSRPSARAWLGSKRCAHMPVPFQGQFNVHVWKQGDDDIGQSGVKVPELLERDRSSAVGSAPIMMYVGHKNNRARAGSKGEAIHYQGVEITWHPHSFRFFGFCTFRCTQKAKKPATTRALPLCNRLPSPPTPLLVISLMRESGRRSRASTRHGSAPEIRLMLSADIHEFPYAAGKG